MASNAYRQAGVDRDAAGSAKERIFSLARSTFTEGVLGDIGAFGALYKVSGYRDPVLVAHTDGVGTKLRVASLMGRYDTVGEDIVHHCTNDIFTCGAQPLFFLDYMGMGALATEKVEQLMVGLSRACKGLGCALIGGETAEMPGMYHGEDVELVGFVVGAVEREGVVDGSGIRAGDALLGLPSSGLHTNGYSLVRRVFGIDDDPTVLDVRHDELGATLGEALLVPHRSYVGGADAGAGPHQGHGAHHRRRLSGEHAADAAGGPVGAAGGRGVGGPAPLPAHSADGRHRRGRDAPGVQHGRRHDRGRDAGGR